MLDKETRRIGMRTVLLSAGLSLALVLGACGDSPPVADEGIAGDDAAIVEEDVVEEDVVEEDVVAETEVQTDTEVLEGEEEVIDTEEVEGSEVLTQETGVITDVQVVENIDVITETELVTETIVTEVITQSEVLTESAVIVEEGAEVDEVAEVTVTPTPERETIVVTDTEIVTDTVVVPEDEVDPSDVTPTPAPEQQAQIQALVVVGVTDAPDTFVRASTLTDYDFESINGEDIGDIEDMLIDLNDGAILFLAVEYGGFLDLGDRDIYLPLSAFTIGQDGGLYLAMAEEELEAYPEVSDDFPNFEDADWGAQLDEYWAGVGVEAPVSAERASGNTAWASNLIGFPLLGWGDVQASVMDLLINLQSGKAEYALVAGDTLGTDVDGPYIVPIQALTVDRAGEQITFEGEVDDNVLTEAPRLSAETFPEGEVIGGDFDEEINNTWRDLGFDWWDGE